MVFVKKTEKMKSHSVELVFSGKSHFFKVTNSEGVTYDLAIQAKCTCRYCSAQGIPNGKVCSYIMSACKAISEDIIK